jgi:hypothetical protein
MPAPARPFTGRSHPQGKCVPTPASYYQTCWGPTAHGQASHGRRLYRWQVDSTPVRRPAWDPFFVTVCWVHLWVQAVGRSACFQEGLEPGEDRGPAMLDHLTPGARGVETVLPDSEFHHFAHWLDVEGNLRPLFGRQPEPDVRAYARCRGPFRGKVCQV